LEGRRRLRDGNTTLSQDAADMVHNGRRLVHEQLTQPMQRLNVLLLHRLDGYEPHDRAAGRFDNGFRVVAVVLVGLHERGHVLWADQQWL
jgi:hypothetical protein